MKKSIDREVKEQLKAKQEKEYAKFSQKLIPTIELKKILGVRLPTLRKLATHIHKQYDTSEIVAYIDTPHQYFEEQMLAGFLIGKIGDIELVGSLIEKFVPIIDNWSTCDSFCSSLKIAREYPEEIWNILAKYWSSPKEFEFRFCCVMALNYYLKQPYLEQLEDLLGKRMSNDYYAKIAVAWLYCSIYPMDREKCMDLVKNEKDEFIYRKSISKLCDSYLVEERDKELFRGL